MYVPKKPSLRQEVLKISHNTHGMFLQSAHLQQASQYHLVHHAMKHLI